MTEHYLNDTPLKRLVDVATASCAELAPIDPKSNAVINYETGKTFHAPDPETALFLGQARNFVLELARRIQALERPQVYTERESDLCSCNKPTFPGNEIKCSKCGGYLF